MAIAKAEIEARNGSFDALALGQRIATLLATGRRVSTYKLATLLALLDYCVEHLPADPSASLAVPIDALSRRVIELYWPQVRPYGDRGVLRQNEQRSASILDLVADLRAEAMRRGLRSSHAIAEQAPHLLNRAVRRISLVLAQQPLTALQTPGRGSVEGASAFLFDDSWLHKKVQTAVLAEHGWSITLFPGVASALARLGGLLRPVIEVLWTQDVGRLNRLHIERDDLAVFLFGADRAALTPLAEPLWNAQQGRCFYCEAAIPHFQLHIDHVLPFTRANFDGLSNLVAVDAACNLSKSMTLPALGHLGRVMARRISALDDIARSTNWPVARTRFLATARGLYLTSPAGTPLWRDRVTFEALDLSVAERMFADLGCSEIVPNGQATLAADR